MNNKDVMNMLDDEFILEAEPKAIVRNKHRKIKFSAGAAVAAACIGLTAITAGAVAVYRISHPSLETAYDSQAQQVLEQKGLTRNEVTSNAHFDVTTDAVLTDDYICRIMLTAIPKDNEAIKSVQSVSAFPYKLHIKLSTESGAVIPGSCSTKYNSEKGTLGFYYDIPLDYDVKELLADSPAVVTFVDLPLLEDICLKIKPEKNLESKSAVLPNGQRLIISPTQLTIISDSNLNSETMKAFSFVWKDGARERFLESIGITPEQDAANMAKNPYGYNWEEMNYFMLGKHYDEEVNNGLGGSGMGFFLDGQPEYDEHGNYVSGGGRFAKTYMFGTVLDLDDILGIQYGLDKLMF